MFDELSEVFGGLVVIAVILCLCLLVGSCVQDYRKSTPQAAEVLIIDKRYTPAHQDTTCSTTDSNNHFSCHTTYYPESWAVEYADESRHAMAVSKGTWEALRIGEKKVIRYNLGGGFWHARYDERFEWGPIVAENAMPVR